MLRAMLALLVLVSGITACRGLIDGYESSGSGTFGGAGQGDVLGVTGSNTNEDGGKRRDAVIPGGGGADGRSGSQLVVSGSAKPSDLVAKADGILAQLDTIIGKLRPLAQQAAGVAHLGQDVEQMFGEAGKTKTTVAALRSQAQKAKEQQEKQAQDWDAGGIAKIGPALVRATRSLTWLSEGVTTVAKKLKQSEAGTCADAGRSPQHGGVGTCKTDTLEKGKSCVPTCVKGATPTGVRSCSPDGDAKLTDSFRCLPKTCAPMSDDELRKVMPDMVAHWHGVTDGSDPLGTCAQMAGATGFPHGATCQPKCQPKYIPRGKWSCAYGVWSTKDFACDDPECDGSKALDNGNKKMKNGPCSSEMPSGATCKQEKGEADMCSDGYEALGSRVCNGGDFSTDDLRCAPKPCDATKNLDAKTVAGPGTCKASQPHGSTCVPECKKQFAPSRKNPVVKCDKGKIVGGFQCLGAPCKIDPDKRPDHTKPDRVRPKGWKNSDWGSDDKCRPYSEGGDVMDHGDRCQWYCKDGYTAKHKTAMQCQFGEILKDSQVCAPNACKKADADPYNGAGKPCPSELAHGASCEPTCDTGFQGNGKKRSCDLGSLVDEFKCEPKPCAMPDSLFKAFQGRGDCPAAGNGPLVSGKSCKPACAKGYLAEGKLSCDKGKLSGERKCTAQTCEIPVRDHAMTKKITVDFDRSNEHFATVEAEEMPDFGAENKFSTDADADGDSSKVWTWTKDNPHGTKSIECLPKMRERLRYKAKPAEIKLLGNRFGSTFDCNANGYHIIQFSALGKKLETHIKFNKKYIPPCAKGYMGEGAFVCGPEGTLTRSDFKCVPKPCIIPAAFFRPNYSAYEDVKKITKYSAGKGKGPGGSDLPSFAFPSDIDVKPEESNDCVEQQDGSYRISHGGRCALACSGHSPTRRYGRLRNDWYTMVTGAKDTGHANNVITCKLGELNVPGLRNPLCEFYRNADRSLVRANFRDSDAEWRRCQGVKDRYGNWGQWGTSQNRLGSFVECVPKSCTLSNKILLQHTYYAIPLEHGRDVTIPFGARYVPDCPVGFDPVGAITCGHGGNPPRSAYDQRERRKAKYSAEPTVMPDMHAFHCKPKACASWETSYVTASHGELPGQAPARTVASRMHGVASGECGRRDAPVPSAIPRYWKDQRPESRDLYEQRLDFDWKKDPETGKWGKTWRTAWILKDLQSSSTEDLLLKNGHRLGTFDTWGTSIALVNKQWTDPGKRVNTGGEKIALEGLKIASEKMYRCTPACDSSTEQPFTFFKAWQSYSKDFPYSSKYNVDRQRGPPLECRLGQFVVPGEIIDPKAVSLSYPRTSGYPKQAWAAAFDINKLTAAAYCVVKPCDVSDDPIFGSSGDCPSATEMYSGDYCTPACDKGYEVDPNAKPPTDGFVQGWDKKGFRNKGPKKWRECEKGVLTDFFKCVPKGCTGADSPTKVDDIACKDLRRQDPFKYQSNELDHPCERQTPKELVGGAGDCPAKLKHGESCTPTCPTRFRTNAREGGSRSCWLGEITDTVKCLPLFDSNMCPVHRKSEAMLAKEKAEAEARAQRLAEEQARLAKAKHAAEKKKLEDAIAKARKREEEGGATPGDEMFVLVAANLAELPRRIANSVPSLPARGGRLSDSVLDWVQFGPAAKKLGELNAEAKETDIGKLLERTDYNVDWIFSKFCINCPPEIGLQVEQTKGVCACSSDRGGKNRGYTKSLCTKDKIPGLAGKSCASAQKTAAQEGHKGCKWKPDTKWEKAKSEQCRSVDAVVSEFTSEYDKLVAMMDCTYNLFANLKWVAEKAEELEEKTMEAKVLFKEVRATVKALEDAIPIKYIQKVLHQVDEVVLKDLEDLSDKLHEKIEKLNKKLPLESVKDRTEKTMTKLEEFMTMLVNVKSGLINGYWAKVLRLEAACPKVPSRIAFMCGAENDKGETDRKLFATLTKTLQRVGLVVGKLMDNLELFVHFRVPLEKLFDNFPDLSIVKSILAPIKLIMKPLKMPFICPKVPGDRRRRRRRLLMIAPPKDDFVSAEDDAAKLGLLMIAPPEDSVATGAATAATTAATTSSLVHVPSQPGALGLSTAMLQVQSSNALKLRGAKGLFGGLVTELAKLDKDGEIYKSCNTNQVRRPKHELHGRTKEALKAGGWLSELLMHQQDKSSVEGLMYALLNNIFWKVEVGSKGWQEQTTKCAEEGGTCTCPGYVDYGTKDKRWGLTDTMTLTGGKITCTEENFPQRPKSLKKGWTHQDGSCLARHCECVSIKTLENEGWKQLSTETKENLGDDLSKLDQAAQWVEDKTKPNHCTNYGGECTCTGIVQMGFKSWKHGTVWWGSRLNFRTNDCPGGGGGGYSCASVKCDKSEFGDPYPDVRKANLLSCRCLPLDLSKDARKQRQETVARQCIESIVEPLSKGDLDSKDADATCADLAKYIANEEVYARAMNQQWVKQRNRNCEANELGRIITEAFEAIGDAIMSAFFFKDTVGGCLKYWMEKVSGAIDPILNPILKVLQFDKLFDPIKKVILDAMQPLLDILNVELPALPELPAVPEFPDLTPDLTKLREFLEKIRVDFPKELTCAVSAHGGQREARL